MRLSVEERREENNNCGRVEGRWSDVMKEGGRERDCISYSIVGILGFLTTLAREKVEGIMENLSHTYCTCSSLRR